MKSLFFQKVCVAASAVMFGLAVSAANHTGDLAEAPDVVIGGFSVGDVKLMCRQRNGWKVDFRREEDNRLYFSFHYYDAKVAKRTHLVAKLRIDPRDVFWCDAIREAADWMTSSLVIEIPTKAKIVPYDTYGVNGMGLPYEAGCHRVSVDPSGYLLIK